MAIQHCQAHCPTCNRPTLHVRNTYDVPHLAHLTLVGFAGLAAVLTRDVALAAFCGAVALAWLAVWAAHALINLLAGSVAFRCQTCGQSIASHVEAQRELDERQQLARAMAKAGKAGA